MNVEVPCEAAADACDHSIRAAPLQSLGRSVFQCVGVFAHGTRIAEYRFCGYPE